MKKTNKKRFIITAIFIIFILVIVILGFKSCNQTESQRLMTDDEAVDWNGKQELPKAKLDGDIPAIAIPGFDSITFISNQTKQQVNFYNPEINDCYFLMTLAIDDEEVWQSGNVAPGKGYYEIELDRTYPVTKTNGYLKIRCFKEDGAELNSAIVKFDVYFKENG